MKKEYLFFVLLSIFLLSACSLKEDVAEQYKKESPLEADIDIPATFSPKHKERINIVLTQDGEKVEDADFVHYEIWKTDGSLHYFMEEAKEMGGGTYTLSRDFDSDGLYIIKVHASNKGSVIMPQKQFIVGELSEAELEYLQKDVPKSNAGHEHHH